MRKFFSCLAVAAMAIVFGLLSAGSASAIGGEQLGCRVLSGGNAPAYTSPFCRDSKPPNPYLTANFQVLDQTGSYTYVWSVPSAYTGSITSGCTSSSSSCSFRVPNASEDVTVSVTITQNRQSATLSAMAQIEPWCGNYLC